MNRNTKKLVLTALFMGIICIATMLAIPLAVGYINLGDAVIILAGLLLGPQYGLLAGALGASMADLLLGYPQYMITTFLVKGFMGFVAGKTRDLAVKKRICFCIGAGLVMVGGYYVTEVVFYGNYIAPLAAMPFNVLQFSIGILLSSLLIKSLDKFRV